MSENAHAFGVGYLLACSSGIPVPLRQLVWVHASFLAWSQLGHSYNPSIMEQTLIFSGLSHFPGGILRKGSLPVLCFSWVTCFLFFKPIRSKLGFSNSGIIASDWLYPLKPKNPIWGSHDSLFYSDCSFARGDIPLKIRVALFLILWIQLK